MSYDPSREDEYEARDEEARFEVEVARAAKEQAATQVHQDREELLSGPPREQLGADHRRKFDEAMARRDAEVAAHERAEASRDLDGMPSGWVSGEIEPYLKRHPEMLEGVNLDPGESEAFRDMARATRRKIPTPEQLAASSSEDACMTPEPAPAADGTHAVDGLLAAARGDLTVGEAATLAGHEAARFGDRLREALDNNATEIDFRLDDWEHSALLRIAAAIDRDAEQMREEEGERLGYVRTRIEEAVERLKYAVVYPGSNSPARGLSAQDASVDVVNAENLLAELGLIFGGIRAPREPVA